MYEEHQCYSDFYDFARYSVAEWRDQSRKYKDVSVRYDYKQRCYYRKISNVPGTRSGNVFTPNHPLITYKQSNLPPCKHMKESTSIE